MTPLIVKNLNKTFVSGFWPFTATKEFNAVKNISFELNKGEVL
ncbi:dipeptide/oligopeptide/nickel ABC transporter ATP-binding protein, partial [Candidatus Dependentiae bacterium]|nr:dipeptide/oligopeptide/nickel ABC transporter ATP-binding protein [Candidatus Dependentiae bacterium]